MSDLSSHQWNELSVVLYCFIPLPPPPPKAVTFFARSEKSQIQPISRRALFIMQREPEGGWLCGEYELTQSSTSWSKSEDQSLFFLRVEMSRSGSLSSTTTSHASFFSSSGNRSTLAEDVQPDQPWPKPDCSFNALFQSVHIVLASPVAR